MKKLLIEYVVSPAAFDSPSCN